MGIDTLPKHREVMRRMLRVLRDDLQSMCEVEAVGGVAAAHGEGELRFEPDVIESVLDLCEVIAEAESLIGREPGPAWLDRVIDGRRPVEAAVG